jgi:hypothetical protein
MPVVKGLTTIIPAGASVFRITSPNFLTSDPADHLKVVNGQGPVINNSKGRYNHGLVPTVYLAETIEPCFAEKMFYFHRETLRALDLAHLIGAIPPYEKRFILWEVVFKHEISDIFDMNINGAHAYFGIYPAMAVNPSQDYEHLKEKRGDIQGGGYKGIRVRSSRSTKNGNTVVLFENQSSNVDSVTPYEVDFRLITPKNKPLTNHANEFIDFSAGQIKFTRRIPAKAGKHFSEWEKLKFHH